MSFATGEGDSHRGAIETFLFGKPITFNIVDPAFIQIVWPSPQYKRARYICHVADEYYYLPRINELWHVPMWTETLQRALDARNAAAGLPSWWNRTDLPAFVPEHRVSGPFRVRW